MADPPPRPIQGAIEASRKLREASQRLRERLAVAEAEAQETREPIGEDEPP